MRSSWMRAILLLVLVISLVGCVNRQTGPAPLPEDPNEIPPEAQLFSL